MTKLVSKVLELAKLEAHQVAMKREAFASTDVVQDVMQRRSLTASHKGVNLRTDVPEHLPLACGDGVVHWPMLLSVAMFPLAVLACVLLAPHEEKRMVEQFGVLYRAYPRRVPMFLPRIREWSRFLAGSGEAADANEA